RVVGLGVLNGLPLIDRHVLPVVVVGGVPLRPGRDTLHRRVTLGEGVAGQGVHVVVRHRVTHPVLALGGSGLTRHALLLDEVIGAQRRLLALPGLDDDLLANTMGTATRPSRVSRDTPTAASGAT